ncbi:MAG: hypothetical protein ABI599_00935 [Flavobacteriales bacterium]
MGAEVGNVSEFQLPAGLLQLIALRIWPSKDGPSMTAQQFDPIFPTDRVRRFAPEETVICLEPPPFGTIAGERAAGGGGDFWERFGALHQIVPEKAVVIGDFGLGSDAPIILDYHRNMTDPPVLRLRWNADGRTEWVEGARNFDHFAELLGLSDSVK